MLFIGQDYYYFSSKHRLGLSSDYSLSCLVSTWLNFTSLGVLCLRPQPIYRKLLRWLIKQLENRSSTLKKFSSGIGLSFLHDYTSVLHVNYKNILKIILRSGPAHSTTTIGGQYVQDPLGNHFTFCYKDENQKQAGTHIACHGYTPSAIDYTLTQATFTTEKPDKTRKKRNGKYVWPAVADLDDAGEIGYHHEAEEK